MIATLFFWTNCQNCHISCIFTGVGAKISIFDFIGYQNSQWPVSNSATKKNMKILKTTWPHSLCCRALKQQISKFYAEISTHEILRPALADLSTGIIVIWLLMTSSAEWWILCQYSSWWLASTDPWHTLCHCYCSLVTLMKFVTRHRIPIIITLTHQQNHRWLMFTFNNSFTHTHTHQSSITFWIVEARERLWKSS